MRHHWHHTEESKAKISCAGMGRIVSEETRVKLRKANLGKIVTEATRVKLSKAQKANCQNPEYNAHMSKVRTGRIPTTKARANMSKAQMGRTHTQATKSKMSEVAGVRWQDPEYRAAMSQMSMGNEYALGYRHTEETKTKMSKSQKLLWQDLEYRDRSVKAMRLGCLVHPNKPELVLVALLESVYPSEWAFVGDGTLIIDGLNPDFVNTNGKKQIIELFGRYWHSKEIIKNRRSDEERIKSYASLGYSTLIIWDDELKEPEKVLVKIARMGG